MKATALKRIVAAAVLAVMVMCMFTGCSSTDDGVYTVGICQLVTHDALDAATEGFKAALTEKLGDKVEFDFKDAAGDSPTCATIATQFVTDKVDLIMANATPALQAAMAATGDIPIVATSITDFATALEIDDWTGKSGINVTGTADLAPLDKQAAMVKELVPDAKKVGILYCSAEPNSKYQATVVADELKKLGLETKEFTIADSNEIASVATTACDQVDVIYIPTDNTLASAAAAVEQIAGPKNIPVVAGEEGICKGCGVATLSISYYDIGYKAGMMAYEILVNGKNAGDMEIQTADTITKKYVESRATALELTVPSDYVAIEMDAE